MWAWVWVWVDLEGRGGLWQKQRRNKACAEQSTSGERTRHGDMGVWHWVLPGMAGTTDREAYADAAATATALCVCLFTSYSDEGEFKSSSKKITNHKMIVENGQE